MFSLAQRGDAKRESQQPRRGMLCTPSHFLPLQTHVFWGSFQHSRHTAKQKQVHASMTNLELFPRGKGAAEAASTPKAGASNNKQDGKKRKAPPTSPGDRGGNEKEWLFGTGGDKSKQSATGKRPRGESSAAASTGSASVGVGAKGKVSLLCVTTKHSRAPSDRAPSDDAGCFCFCFSNRLFFFSLVSMSMQIRSHTTTPRITRSPMS